MAGFGEAVFSWPLITREKVWEVEKGEGGEKRGSVMVISCCPVELQQVRAARVMLYWFHWEFNRCVFQGGRSSSWVVQRARCRGKPKTVSKAPTNTEKHTPLKKHRDWRGEYPHQLKQRKCCHRTGEMR